MRIHFSIQFKPLRTLASTLVFGMLFFPTLSFAATVTASLVPSATTVQATLPAVNTQNTSALSPCYYVATDTYVGPNSQSGYTTGPYSTENIGAGTNGIGGGYISQPSPPMTDANNNLVLAFRGGSWSSNSTYNGTWNASTPSPLSVPVLCTGIYQVIFTLQLQASYYSVNATLPPQAAPSITVYPCVQTTDGATAVYGSLLSGGVCPTTGPSFTFNPSCNGGNYCTVMTFPFSTQIQLQAGQTVGPPAIHASAPLNVTGGEFTVIYIGP